jgi:hypothetical protein
MHTSLVLSPLPHLWLIDLDGTVVKHNGHLGIGGDTILPGVREFWDKIPDADHVLILTARDIRYKEPTVKFLRDHGLRYSEILFGMPRGERVLVNDRKPSGLCTAYALSLPRDQGLASIAFSIDKEL